MTLTEWTLKDELPADRSRNSRDSRATGEARAVTAVGPTCVPPAPTAGADPARPPAQTTDHTPGKIAISREFLRRLPILGMLTDEQLSGAMAVSRLTHYAKKAPVVLKGQTIDHLAILVSGKLQVVDYTADGREIGLNIIQAGGFFGELSVIDRLPRSATLVALTPAAVIHIPGDFARRLFFEYPPLAEAMLVHLARSLRRMSDLRAVQALPHSFQRVYALLDYVKEQAPGGMWVINDLPTHQEIAIMVNTSRETVTRALSSLTAAGVVEKDLRRLLIRKPDALARLAEEGPRIAIGRRSDDRNRSGRR